MPHDIEKLKREKPELFDEQDVPNKSNAKYSKQVEPITPRWFRDMLAMETSKTK